MTPIMAQHDRIITVLSEHMFNGERRSKSIRLDQGV